MPIQANVESRLTIVNSPTTTYDERGNYQDVQTVTSGTTATIYERDRPVLIRKSPRYLDCPFDVPFTFFRLLGDLRAAVTKCIVQQSYEGDSIDSKDPSACDVFVRAHIYFASHGTDKYGVLVNPNDVTHIQESDLPCFVSSCVPEGKLIFCPEQAGVITGIEGDPEHYAILVTGPTYTESILRYVPTIWERLDEDLF